MKTKIIFASAFVAASLVAYLVFSTGQDTPDVVETVSEIESVSQLDGTGSKPVQPKALSKPELLPVDQLVEELSLKMRAQFGDTIDDILVQVSLKDLRLGLEADFPGQGAQMFERIVRNAFPDLADEILLALANMDLYDEWLVDSYLDLNEMDAISKDNTIWNKRNALFGEEDARRIWNEEVAQDVQRERNVKTVSLNNVI